MTVRYLKWITRDMLRDNPGARFVFGDNVERVGSAGRPLRCAARQTPSASPPSMRPVVL